MSRQISVNETFEDTFKRLCRRVRIDLDPRVIRALANEATNVHVHVVTNDRQMPVTFDTITLSPRELQVLKLMAAGFDNGDIAKQFQLSEHTVKSHVRHILERMGAKNRTHAVTLGFCYGFIRTTEYLNVVGGSTPRVVDDGDDIIGESES